MAIDDAGGKSDRLRSVIRTNEVARALNFDLDRSVELLLKTAARSVGSEEASILIRDADNGNLLFMKAIGEVSDQLVGIVVPSGKGIAGFVAASGQPMAISDVGKEESFYAEVDKKTGFSTEILLATPLIFEGEIIGVLEFVNRIGDPPYDSFTPEEMDRAAVYAEAIAALVNAFLASQMTAELASRICEGQDPGDISEIRKWIDELKGKQEHKDLLELAVMVKGIAEKGESHRRLCRELLESVSRFANDDKSVDYSQL